MNKNVTKDRSFDSFFKFGGTFLNVITEWMFDKSQVYQGIRDFLNYNNFGSKGTFREYNWRYTEEKERDPDRASRCLQKPGRWKMSSKTRTEEYWETIKAVGYLFIKHLHVEIGPRKRVHDRLVLLIDWGNKHLKYMEKDFNEEEG